MTAGFFFCFSKVHCQFTLPNFCGWMIKFICGDLRLYYASDAHIHIYRAMFNKVICHLEPFIRKFIAYFAVTNNAVIPHSRNYEKRFNK